MTSMLIAARTVFSLACSDAMRAAGAIRVLDGRSRRSGDLAPEPAKKSSTHQAASSIRVLYRRTIICFRASSRVVRAGMNLPLMGWLRSVPHSYA